MKIYRTTQIMGAMALMALATCTHAHADASGDDKQEQSWQREQQEDINAQNEADEARANERQAIIEGNAEAAESWHGTARQEGE